MLPEVKVAVTEEDLLKCIPALHEFRPHIPEDELLPTLKRMVAGSHHIIYVQENGMAVSVAVFETGYKLHRGNYLYVDDLATLPTYRKKGYAGLLMDFISDYAKKHGIEQIHLDSGVQRFDAHRFYLSRGFIISSHHFVIR